MTQPEVVERPCPRCERPIFEPRERQPGRPKRWCSQNCRRAASEERKAAANGVVAVSFIATDATLDDHVEAVMASPAACRRVLRTLVEMDGCGALGDSRWNSVAATLAKIGRDDDRGARRLR